MAHSALPNIVGLLSSEDQMTLQGLGQRRTYADGEVVHLTGEEAAMGVVVAGMVKLYRQLSNGQQMLTVSLTPGQHYADITALGLGRRTHTGIAAGATTVDHYPRERFERLLEHAGIVRALYEIAAHRLVQAIELAEDIRLLPPEVRLAKTIVALHRATGGRDRIESLQEDLANLLGVSAMTLAKALKVLRREGLVETGYRYVAVPDAARLQAWVDDRSLD
jgi:CRP-like cAMP-binding protein